MKVIRKLLVNIHHEYSYEKLSFASKQNLTTYKSHDQKGLIPDFKAVHHMIIGVTYSKIHYIILVATENMFEKIQHFLMLKILRKLGRDSFSFIKII